MSDPKTTIDGFTAEMMSFDNTTNCYISKRNYSASLAALIDTGVLTDDDNEIEVKHSTIDAIEAWALEHGY